MITLTPLKHIHGMVDARLLQTARTCPVQNIAFFRRPINKPLCWWKFDADVSLDGAVEERLVHVDDHFSGFSATLCSCTTKRREVDKWRPKGGVAANKS